MDSMDDSEVVMIPHDRIGVLIGRHGETKQGIEKFTETEITIDSREGEVDIAAKGDPLKYWKAVKIVRAIARGFSPEHALRLLSDEIIFELLEIQEYTGKNQSAMKSKRGRVIGEHGAARERIEEETGANISVYGKTVGIIGTQEEVEKAGKAVQGLLGGASHDSVFLRMKRRFGEERFEL